LSFLLHNPQSDDYILNPMTFDGINGGQTREPNVTIPNVTIQLPTSPLNPSSTSTPTDPFDPPRLQQLRRKQQRRQVNNNHHHRDSDQRSPRKQVADYGSQMWPTDIGQTDICRFLPTEMANRDNKQITNG
jgi:hypothetical protein